MHDLFTIQRWYSQTEFVAYQMVQMIQSISQNRSDKKITLADLRYIVSAAYLTIYPGTTMYWKNQGHEFGHFPHPFVYYVKGLSNGNASCIWRVQLHPSHSGSVSPRTMDGGCVSEPHSASIVQYKTDVSPTQIYPALKIKPGEIKIIVEALIFYGCDGNYWRFADGRRGVPSREAFGLFLITPKRTGSGYFNSVVIFSPNPGLFDEGGPK